MQGADLILILPLDGSLVEKHLLFSRFFLHSPVGGALFIEVTLDVTFEHS